MAHKVYPDSNTATTLAIPLNTPVDSASMTKGIVALISDTTGPGSVATPGYSFGTTLFIRISMSLPASNMTTPTVTMHARNAGANTVGPAVVITATASPGQGMSDGTNQTEAAAAWFAGPGPYTNNVYEIQVFIEIDGTAIDIQMTQAGRNFVWVVADNESETLQPWIQLTPVPAFGGLVGEGADTNVQKLQINNHGTGDLTVTQINGGLAAPFSLSPAMGQLPATIPPNQQTATTLGIGFQPTATGNANSPGLTVDGDSGAVSGPSTAHNNAFTLSAKATSLEVVMLLDTSGSMDATDTFSGASRLSELQTAASQFLDYLGHFAGGAGTLGVVQFPGSDPDNFTTFSVVPSEPIPPKPTAEKNKINALTSTNNTPMKGGLQEVFNGGFFSNTTSNLRWMLLMSDGKWNEPLGADPHSEKDNLPANVRIFSAGYGKAGQVDYQTLQDIAGWTPGGQTSQVDLGEGVSALILAQNFKKAITANLTINAAADPQGTILPGQELRHEVLITPYDTKAVFSLNWSSPNAGLMLSLLSPTCDLITADSADKNPGITFSSDARYEMFGIDASYLKNTADPSSPRHGTWRLIVNNPGQIIIEAGSAAAAGEPYSYDVLTSSSLRMRVDLDQSTYYAGDPIVVSATVTADGLPVNGASAKLSLTSPGQSMDNWLAGVPITDAEYQSAAGQLAGKDAWPVYIKAFAAQLKGLTFNGLPQKNTIPMTEAGRTGVYSATVNQTTIPDGHTLYVVVTGTTSDGVSFRREQAVDVRVGVRPDPIFTQFTINYGAQTNPRLLTGVVSVTPRDRFGNFVALIDPASSQYIQLQAQGATLDPTLATTFNGTYTSGVTYTAGSNPTFSLTVGGQPVFTGKTIVPVDKFHWVDQVISFKPGLEGAPGANQHVTPTDVLGDILTKPASEFVALGGYGSIAAAVKGQQIQAQGDDDITVFVQPTDDLRAYLVEVLPSGADCDDDHDDKWIAIGTSPGVTASFALHNGGVTSASAVRITDKSGRTRDSQFAPLSTPPAATNVSSAPGVNIRAVGVKSVGEGSGEGDGGDTGVCIRIRALNPQGDPLGGTVDLEFQPQEGGQTTTVKAVSAAQDADVSGLARFPQVSVYEVTVTPTDVFKPTSQFVTIPASGFNVVVFKIDKS